MKEICKTYFQYNLIIIKQLFKSDSGDLVISDNGSVSLKTTPSYPVLDEFVQNSSQHWSWGLHIAWGF